MKRYTTIFFGAVLLAFGLSGTVLANDNEHCRHAGPPGEHFGRGFERLIDDLGLTEEQMDQVKAIRQESHDKMEKNWNQGKDFRKELMDAVDNNASDKELRKLIEQQNAAHTEQMLAMLKTHRQILSVLTDEQRAKLKEKRQQMMEKMEERMDKRPPHPEP